MNNRIIPVGLKGNEVNDRMKELMGMSPIAENTKSSSVELTKKGPDGNVYGIVRENHEYYIKTTNKTKNLQLEDFHYIGGLKNKKSEAYPTYSKAIKHLNLKFNSLNEAYGVSNNINVFEDDNLIGEDIASFYQQTGSGFSNEGNMEGHDASECCGAPVMEGMCSACGTPSMNNQSVVNPIDSAHSEHETAHDRMYNSDEWVQAQNDAIGGNGVEELDEFNQAVQNMMDEKNAPLKPNRPMYENKLSIARSIEQMDGIIDSVVSGKKKIYTIK